MSSCLYCAQENTKKDIFGYCKKYNCFSKSGKKDVLEKLINEINDIFIIPKNARGQIGRVVSNPYSLRTRRANDIMYKAEKEFGFVPSEIYNRIPMQNREKWDKNIRW